MIANMKSRLSLFAVIIAVGYFQTVGGQQTNTCPTCEKAKCITPTGCQAGTVLDACGCCEECGLTKGSRCGMDGSTDYGRCGSGLVCSYPLPLTGTGSEPKEPKTCVDLNEVTTTASTPTTSSTDACQRISAEWKTSFTKWQDSVKQWEQDMTAWKKKNGQT